MSAVVISFTDARRRRVEQLAWEVAGCRDAVREATWRFGAKSWQREVCEAELIEAERLLSEAQGMPRSG